MPFVSHEAFAGFVKLGWLKPEHHEEHCPKDPTCPEALA